MDVYEQLLESWIHAPVDWNMPDQWRLSNDTIL